MALLIAAGLWYVVPRQSPTPAVAGTPSVTAGPDAPSTGAGPGAAPTSSRPSPSPGGQPRSSCRVGEPERLVIPALGVDAPFERIGLDRAGRRDARGRLPLGNPTDRTRAGWYAAGPRPGSGTGTVLTTGHTYRDGSAIFKEDFARRIAVRQLIQVRQDNGSVCSYRVSKVWREVNAARGYPRLVESEHLYDFSGPERLLLATCGGSWNALAQDYEDISVLLAVPVGRA